MAGVHAFNSDEILSSVLVFVLVSENNFGERCSSAGIVNDVLDNSFDISDKSQPFFARLTYPALSAKSSVLKRAGATLLQVCAAKTELPPRLWAIKW